MTHLPILVTATGDGTHSRKQLRGARYVLTSRGVRLPAQAQGDFAARVRAALASVDPRVAVSGPTAARIRHMPIPLRIERDVRIHVTAPRSIARPRRRDLHTHQGDLHDCEVTRVNGMLVTTGVRTYVDLASMLKLPDLVAVGDVLLAQGVSPDEILHIAQLRKTYPGRSLAIDAIEWLDGAAESPQESRLRVNLRLAGLPRPRVNAVITDRVGDVVARGDLVFDEYRLIVEYDGDVHLTREQHRRDGERRALLQGLGWMVIELTAGDLHDPRRAVAKVRAALRSCGAPV